MKLTKKSNDRLVELWLIQATGVGKKEILAKSEDESAKVDDDVAGNDIGKGECFSNF